MKPYQNRIVVKVGTSTLTNELGKSDLRCTFVPQESLRLYFRIWDMK